MRNIVNLCTLRPPLSSGNLITPIFPLWRMSVRLKHFRGVIPAKAGIHFYRRNNMLACIPACARTTLRRKIHGSGNIGVIKSGNGALRAVSGIFTSIVSITIPDSRKRLPG